MPQTIRVAAVVWTFLSVLVTFLNFFSFSRPAWVIDVRKEITLGLYSYCLRSDAATEDEAVVCGKYGGHFDFSHLPSTTWQVTCILCACACGLLALSSAMSISTFFIKTGFRRKMTLGAGCIQIMAVFLLITGYAIFPAGLDSNFVRHYCPGASKYNTGKCSLGWQYLIGITGTALAVFCPFLAYNAETAVLTHSPEIT